jgi:hypothetical protein
MIVANYLVIHQLEDCLHPEPVLEVTPDEPSTQVGRLTRGNDNSARYMGLLPRKTREERTQDPVLEPEPEPIPLQMEVNNIKTLH